MPVRRLAAAVLLASGAPALAQGARPSPEASVALPDPRPVVLTGAEAPALLGEAPEAIRAMAVRGGALAPIPVQVDERFEYDAAVVYADLDPQRCARPAWCRDVLGHVVEVGYADPGTQVGPDPDPALDADDEIALMLADFGPRAAAPPPGAVELEAATRGHPRYAYLLADAGLPLAPQAHVEYRPTFARGPYLATYDREGREPPYFMNWLYGYPSGNRPASNPETTTLTTPHYQLGFRDRWVLDQLRIAGSADLLDVDMVAFGPGVCQRTPHTASLSEGGFLVNRAGPVRAIRRVIGFNSGPLAELQWTMYARTAESRAALRVHPIPGAMSYLDLTPEAHGAIYRNAATPLGVLIDGRRDVTLKHGLPDWETVTADGWGYAVLHEAEVDGVEGGLRVETTYRDDREPYAPACMLDDEDYTGAHGVWVRQKVPNTDPRRGEHARLALRRTFVFGGDPARSVETLRRPLAVTVR